LDRAACGAAHEHLELERALDHLRPGDTLIVWKLDRVGRSLRRLIDIVRSPRSKSSAFAVSRSQSTRPPGGRLVFHVFAALPEFDRDLIRERTQAGLAAALGPPAPGVRGGRTHGAPQSMAQRQLYGRPGVDDVPEQSPDDGRPPTVTMHRDRR
jgi:DNA invertase Pin-like site-specific DNA recombinase